MRNDTTTRGLTGTLVVVGLLVSGAATSYSRLTI